MNDISACKRKAIAHGFPVWALMTVRLPLLFLSAYEGCQSWREGRAKNKSSGCQSVSIIVPTLNEERSIVKCLRSVSINRHVVEMIVVDAGSTDQTRRLARQGGAHVIIHNQPVENGGGRGGQIKAGISSARGDVIVILHADTLLPDGEIDRIMTTLNQYPGVIGGSVGGRFCSPKFRFRIIELANDFRAVFLKISFGDQVQFFRRQPVVSSDLYPGIPLMEDVELSLRLRRLGRQVHLFGQALVSVRRWENVGLRNGPWIFLRVFGYLIRRLWTEPDTAALYQQYYRKGQSEARSAP